MTTDKLSEAIGMIDEDIIEAADRSRTEAKRSRKPLWIGVCSTAACAALITAVALTDPASYISGESIVDSQYSGSSSSITSDTPTESGNGEDTTGTVTDHETADGVISETGEYSQTGEPAFETADIIVDAVTEEIDDVPEDVTETIPDTNDAPEAEEETIPDTNDAPDDPAEDAPTDLPVSYYPTETAKLLFTASYPTVPKSPWLYDFTGAPMETAEAEIETCDCVEDTEEVLEEAEKEELEENSEPKNRDEAHSLWYDNRSAMSLPSGTATNLQGFFTSSMQGYLTSSDGENTAYSPLNMYMAMAMLSATAGGESRDQILSALNAESEESLLEQARLIWNSSYKNDGTSRSVLASSLWLRNDMHYDSNILNTLSKYLRASSYVGDMGSADYTALMRNWLNAQTGFQLKDTVKGVELSEDTVMALISTLDFSAQWIKNDSFEETDTLTSVFHGTDGDVIVDFMNSWDKMPCYFGEDFTAVYLEGEDFRMWFMLPNEGVSPEQVAAGSEVYDLVFGDLRWTSDSYYDVTLSLPKFDISDNTNLRQGMEQLGVTDVFSEERADFSSLTTDTGSYLNKAEQAVRVAINEKGVKASSYTLMENIPTGVPVDYDNVELIFDRPFLFIIENNDGLPMFSGIVNQLEPTAEQSDDIISVDVSICRYDEAEIREGGSTGSPQSYEELQDYLSVYSDRMNLTQYTILYQYDPETAYQITGDELYLYSSTLYKARATYDLLNGETMNREFLLSCAGTAESQIEGLPLLSVGEKYASVLIAYGDKYLAFPELTFAVYRNAAVDYAYHLRFDKIRFVKSDGTDIDLGIGENEEYVITSTRNNPVHYVHKLRLSELAEFLKADWTARGYQFCNIFELPVDTDEADEVIPIE